jgi:RimJ/RimL family protein N-acetyltransferase
MTTALADGKRLLAALKAAAGAPGPNLLLPIGRPPIGTLRPLACRPDRLDPADVRRISEWRNKFVTHFMTEFQANDERTARWLTDFVGPSDRKILFMVDLPDGQTIGQIGIDFIDWETGYGEADAIIRGGEAPKGLMKDALRTALSWSIAQLGLSSLGVRVRSDNSALEFYRKVGFVEQKRVPMRRTEEPGMIRWTEEPGYKDASASLVYMRYEGPR